MSQDVHKPTTSSATIASGESLSTAIKLDVSDGQTIVALTTPSAWTAADISFQVSVDGTTYVPFFDARSPGSASEVTIPSASIPTNAARAFALDPSIFAGYAFIKVQSGVNGASVNQGAARVIKVQVRRV